MTQKDVIEVIEVLLTEYKKEFGQTQYPLEIRAGYDLYSLINNFPNLFSLRIVGDLNCGVNHIDVNDGFRFICYDSDNLIRIFNNSSYKEIPYNKLTPITSHISPSYCNHEWKRMQSAMFFYDYCTKCPENKRV